ncbi:MAG TPA: prolyl oligopeptidase family serine peptidase [Vicinamibacterales bacterium]|nr:prolyl oligopeptidase family serine peptidase [Vicinamibacterales bacterium]
MYAITTVVLMTLVTSIQGTAQAVQFSEREVVFRNGVVELHGTLMLPTVRTPSPAIVFLHGSGPHPRAGFRPYAEEFARLGVASLFFDKRGSGESGGSWITASLDDLAGDALAAVKYLKGEPGIDADRLGFWGISQAGWVAPLAASRSEDVAFMILISGGGASPRESELFSWKREFESAGLSAEETTRATGVLEAYYAYLATGERRAELVARLDELRPGRLSPLAEALDRILPSEDNRANWSWVATYDPAPHIESFTGPILLMFGAEDTDHPTTLATERWREGLGTAGNDRVTLMAFPGAGHGIRMREGYSGSGRAPFADGYGEVQLGWLWRFVIAGAEGQD